MFATNSKADTPLFEFLVRLMRGEDLSFKESADFFRALTERDANPAQIAGSLVALASKGENFEELAGMAKVMQGQALKIKTHHKNYIDIAGTGSSPAKVFNVSTAAAFVIAGAGLAVAKNTSRGVTSKIGSADLLSKLDINISSDPNLAQACLNGAGIAFLFAPIFYPTLRRMADIRRSLGIRTSLNLLGALSNPSLAPMQLLGVWHKSLLEPMAQALSLMGTKKAWVVHGSDGLDEITLDGSTQIAEIRGNKIRTFELSPEDFGLKRATIKNLKVKSAEESAQIVKDILESKRRDEARSLVIMNAAAALIVGDKAKEPIQAARLAEQSIDSGSAGIKLDRLIQTTNKNHH
jgi:anthranilate phosphoribosyltransferase